LGTSSQVGVAEVEEGTSTATPDLAAARVEVYHLGATRGRGAAVL
jgi:hypothetical protein